MGLFDGRSYTYDATTTRSSGHSSKPRAHYARSSRSTTSLPIPSSSSRARSRSASRSWFGGSSSSNYGGGGGGSSHWGGGDSGWGGGAANWFSSFGSGGTSAYKRSPRRGYIAGLVAKLRRLLRELWYYAQKHPVKVFFAVVVPLMSAGGAIGGLLKGVMPGLMGAAGQGYGSFGGGRRGGFGGSSYGGNNWFEQAGGVNGLMQVARAFM